MRKILLLTLAVCCSIIMMAGDITPEQALQQAASFMNARVANGSRRAPVTEQQLTMTQQVSGLYVFNVTNNGGFVIVSNDDIATPILGYSDSGSFNPDNMPENMRVWLQGYANEIAWAKQHGVQKSETTHRAASAVKTPIAPLVQTHWNQDSPYNDLVSSTSYFPTEGAVTGCVATAMAQVMYYTATKAGLSSSYTLKATDSYTTSYGKTIPVVPANTALNWSQMLTEYNGSEESSAKTAVATLMKACGASVHMNYATEAYGGSSANSDIVDNALIEYFGYEDATTQLVDRSYYSYHNWIDMLYNELNQGRAIFYSGQSTGGGHAFVCDGYQGEDYFHINWGWGGDSDNYFKLSALDSDVQGIGGSTSTDGYNFGQNAIVGIQLEGGTGTVLSNPNTVDLTLNSVAASKASMTTDETINITFNITNNSSDDYDGEIGLTFIDAGLGDGKMFLIPAGETQDCVVEFSPNSTGTYKISAYKPNGAGRYSSIDLSKYVTVTVTGGSGTLPTSDDLDLTATLSSIENANAGKTEVYGNDIKAVITISNPSTTTNYKGSFRVRMEYADYPGNYYSQSKTITIPANSSYDFEFSRTDVQQNFNYKFTTCYKRNSEYTTLVDVNSGTTFQLLPGIYTYSDDGTTTVVKATSSYTTPSTALAVNLAGCGVTSVTKNSNPNCLYILGNSDAVPTGLTNVIKKSGDTYTADNITLTDGYNFYSPVDFTATNIEFTYSNDRWADGTAGWNTIILPFDVTTVKADETAIDWFHSSSDTGKQFWLKEFSSDEVGKVYFNFASTMDANTPYIIALPGATFGTEFDLSGKTIKFIGSGTVNKSASSVVTGSNYRFVGNTQAVTTADIYCINAAGSKFELNSGSAAFRPFFKADIFDRTITSLGIGGEDGTTGLFDISSKMDEIGGNVYYDLQGRRVLYPKKGLYILNGKKVIIK